MDPQDHIGVALPVGEQGVHILHRHIGLCQHSQQVGQAGGLVRHLHCPYRGNGDDVTVGQQDVACLEGVIHDQPDQTIVIGLRDGNGPNVDVLFRQQLSDLRQLAGTVFQEYRNLMNVHRLPP